MNGPKLKLAIARMLPDLIDTEWSGMDSTEPQFIGFIWKQEQGWPPVKETEWLYIVSLVEQTLTMGQLCDYEAHLRRDYINEGSPCDSSQFMCCKSFNQRATALCKVKGIKVE